MSSMWYGPSDGFNQIILMDYAITKRIFMWVALAIARGGRRRFNCSRVLKSVNHCGVLNWGPAETYFRCQACGFSISYFGIVHAILWWRVLLFTSGRYQIPICIWNSTRAFEFIVSEMNTRDQQVHSFKLWDAVEIDQGFSRECVYKFHISVSSPNHGVLS